MAGQTSLFKDLVRPTWKILRRHICTGRRPNKERTVVRSPLEVADPDAFSLIQQVNVPLEENIALNLQMKELNRERRYLNLMAAENYPTMAVLEAYQSPILDAEGYPGTRPFGGKQYLDNMERLCWQRALDTFGLDKEEWGVNVQPFSGALANLYTYTALMNPGDQIMGLDLAHGGHISHGYQTSKRKVSEVAHRFESSPYYLNEKTCLIDYDELEQKASKMRPKVIVAGTSAYSRLIDYERMRNIADRAGAFLHADMAHICGLVAAKVIPSPFPSCDVVTTTVNKTFRGSSGAIIFFRKRLEEKMNRTVFPRFQCGTNNRQIVALAVALLHAQTLESKIGQQNILMGAKILAECLNSRGYEILSGGTDNHLVIINLRNCGVDGSSVERILDLASVSCNRNVIPGDREGLRGGIRFGSTAMISRGLQPSGFSRVADILDQGVQIARAVSADIEGIEDYKIATNAKKRAMFRDYVGNGCRRPEIAQLRNEVESWMQGYPPPWHLAF